MKLGPLKGSDYQIETGNPSTCLMVWLPTAIFTKRLEWRNSTRKGFIRFMTDDPNYAGHASMKTVVCFQKLVLHPIIPYPAITALSIRCAQHALTNQLCRCQSSTKRVSACQRKICLVNPTAIASLFIWITWLFQSWLFVFPYFTLYHTIIFTSTQYFIFRAGKGLDRIEYIIWAAVFSLIVYRFILWWRVATFPPIEQISKHKLIP